MSEAILLSKVRERMQKVKDKIDDCEQREYEAKSALKTVQAEAYTHEQDRDSLSNRIEMLEKDYEKLMERLEEKQARLDLLEDKLEEEGSIVKELTSSEMEGDEKLNDLEFTVKEAWKEASITEHSCHELENRLAQTQNELDKVRGRYNFAMEKIERHENILSEAGENVKDLQMKDEDASEREIESEEKIAFLQEQLKETLASAEDAERRAAPLDRSIDELSDGIEKYIRLKEKVESEMEELSELCVILEDDIYNGSKLFK